MKPYSYLKIVLITSYLVSLSGKMYSQHDFLPGYVLTNQNDTIFGFIDDKSSSASLKVCLFKNNLNETEKEYTADDINGYRYTNGRYFVSYRVVDKNFSIPVFFEYLLKGKIEVYRSVLSDKGSSFYMKKDTILIALENQEKSYTDEYNQKYLTRSNKFKGQMLYLMSDQPNLKNQIYRINSLSSGELLKISKKYHNLSCPNEDCIEYSKSKKTIKLTFGLGATYGIPKLYLDEYVAPYSYYIQYYKMKWDFTKNSYKGLSIPIDMQFISVSRKISLLISPGISKVDYKSEQSSSGNTFKYRSLIGINIVSIDLPIGFKYAFRSTAWKVWPTIGFGYKYSKFIEKNNDFYMNIQSYDSTILDNHDTNFDFSTFQDAIYFTGGIDIPLKTSKISFMVNYEMGDGIHRLKFVDSFLKISKTSMLSFGGAFYF